MSLEEMGAELVAIAARWGRYAAQVRRLARQQRGRDARAKQPAKRERCPVDGRPVMTPQLICCSAACRKLWRQLQRARTP